MPKSRTYRRRSPEPPDLSPPERHSAPKMSPCVGLMMLGVAACWMPAIATVGFINGMLHATAHTRPKPRRR